MKHDFHFISKHDPQVRDAYGKVCQILKQVQNEVRNKFTFQYKPVGSYSRNMITFDKKSNKGYDFDINLEVSNETVNRYEAKQIRDALRAALSKVAPDYGYKCAEDSTRVLTIKQVDKGRSKILHSCDFAIVCNEHSEYKYIHFDKRQKTYLWCKQSRGYDLLPQKIEWLKECGHWDKLRKYYLDKKNTNENPDIHSRTIFAIAVHEMCQKTGYYEEEAFIEEPQNCDLFYRTQYICLF